MKAIEYNVDLSQLHKQPDVVAVEQFIKDSEKTNMLITYDDKYECQKRRMCLRTFINQQNLSGKIVLMVRENKLYVIKERWNDLSIKKF